MFIAVGCVLGAAILIGAATSDMPGSATAHSQAKATTTPASASAAPAAPVATVGVDASAAPAPVADSTPIPPTAKSVPVTITGCLERDSDAFRLKDTTGQNAPKARSWKSGFLKKGSASVDVVDAANQVKLPTHVGQRVSVTGMLVDREMQVRSLQRVSTSCAKS
jgi:phosphate-selective porin